MDSIMESWGKHTALPGAIGDAKWIRQFAIIQHLTEHAIM